MCSTKIGKICASDHAMNAEEEMAALDAGLTRFYTAGGAHVPNYLALKKDAAAYFAGKE